MCKLDSYVLKEMVAPFVFGVAAFVIVLVSADLLYDALKLVVREGYPAGVVARGFLYRMPQTIALTLPMATMFSTLMAVGRLSGDGEVVAMRAGGISILRVAAPVLLAGLVITGIAFAFNEAIVPPANAASRRLLAAMTFQSPADEGYLFFRMPEKGRLKRVVTAADFDPATNTMTDVSIVEYRAGKFWESFVAREAVWQGEVIRLQDVQHRQQTTAGPLEKEVARWEYEIGKAPWQVAALRKKPEDMTLAELRVRIRAYQQLPAQQRRELLVLREHYQIRLAMPWCALGFAIIGVALGQRPRRTTTGVGLGISLVILLAYYILFNTLRVIGEQGALPPIAAAWLPNLILFAVGGGLLVDSSR